MIPVPAEAERNISSAAVEKHDYGPQSVDLLFIIGIFILAGLRWTPVLYAEILTGGLPFILIYTNLDVQK